MREGMLSRQASAGVQVGQGSLLESEIGFEEDVSYSKQLTMYPHELAGHSAEYQSTLFGFAEKQANRNKYINAGVATAASGGSSLATILKPKTVATPSEPIA
jgi:hypothetical protein